MSISFHQWPVQYDYGRLLVAFDTLNFLVLSVIGFVYHLWLHSLDAQGTTGYQI